MKKFKVNDAVLAVNGIFTGDPCVLLNDISGVTIDSRKTDAGFLYIPIIGERFDGHDFIPDVFEKGAVCCLSEKELSGGYPYILVRDTVSAFRDLAEFYKNLFSVKTVGITGSVGKTTTKEMINAVLSKSFEVLYTQGNLNNQTGVPLTVFRLEESHEAAVIEMGTNHFGEISDLAKVVRPDICVFTNIGEAHIEYLGSKKGILKAKTEMLEYMKDGGRVIVNGDDEHLLTLRKKRGDVISYGMEAHNDITAKNITPKGLLGTEFTVVIAGSEYDVFVPSPGLHMVYNAMAGIAVGRAFKMGMDSIVRGIADYAPISGRMNIKTAGGITLLNDVYNASPSSMRSALDVLAFAEGRRLCILGDMFELGGSAEKLHREVGEYAAKKDIDIVIGVGKYAEHICKGAESGGGKTYYFETQQSLMEHIGGILRAGDSVLIKASRGMHLEMTAEYIEQKGAEYKNDSI